MSDSLDGTTPRLAEAELVSLLSDPESIAVVGASSDPTSYASRPLRYLREYGFAGRLTVVNPNYESLNGVSCVPSVRDIATDSVNAAIVTLAAHRVPQALEELAAVNVKAAIVVSGDLDAEGGAQRERILAVARDSAMRIIGPNCIGFLATAMSSYLTFSYVAGLGEPRKGSTALVTQSGAMGNSLLQAVLLRGAGVSHWVSTGDEMNVGGLEVICGLLRDDNVRCVGWFLEGLTDIAWLPRLREVIAETRKHVYVVKGARTTAGVAAAAGHTGRIVGSLDVAMSVLREAGVIDVPAMGELADALVAEDLIGPLPGSRIGILSISGGAAVLAADAAIESGRLSMAPVANDPDLEAKLGGRVHVLRNPLDVAGTPTDRFADWITSFAAHPRCDIALAIYALTLNDPNILADSLLNYSGARAPIVIAPFTEDDRLPDDVIDRLAAAGIATMPTPERAIAALSRLVPDTETVSDPAEPYDSPTPGGLEQAIDILGSGFPWAPMAVITDLAEADAAAKRFGFPVVVKLAGRTLQHRADAGGVAVNVGESTLQTETTRMLGIAEAHGDAVIIQSQAPAGIELLLSCIYDREFGAVAYLRPGGTLTELLGGATCVLWHGWTHALRRQQLEAAVVGQLLNGYRGGPTGDSEAVANLVTQILAVVQRNRIQFLELNPVIVHPAGLSLVDAVVSDPASAQSR